MDNNQIARLIEREINERDFTVLHRSSEADGEHGMKTKVTQGKKQKPKTTKPLLCLDCRKYYGDPKICPGCQAYREHQS